MLGLRFAPTSFFPKIQLDDILELEFQISYNLDIPFEYNDKEYYEFVWMFDRLVQQRKNEISDSESSKGKMSLSNLGINPKDLMNMNKSESS